MSKLMRLAVPPSFPNTTSCQSNIVPAYGQVDFVCHQCLAAGAVLGSILRAAAITAHSGARFCPPLLASDISLMIHVCLCVCGALDLHSNGTLPAIPPCCNGDGLHCTFAGTAARDSNRTAWYVQLGILIVHYPPREHIRNQRLCERLLWRSSVDKRWHLTCGRNT